MNFVSKWADHRAKDRTRKQLLDLGDHILEDTGFSRFLLEQGVTAWPWRTPVEAPKAPIRNVNILENAPVANEEFKIAA